MDPVALAKIAAVFQRALAWVLSGGWRYITIGVLLVALSLQHGCLTRSQKALKAERAAHAADVKVCKDNDRKAKDAVAASIASVETLKMQADRDTEAAEKAARDADKRATAAVKRADQVLARKLEPAGVYASIHKLREDTTR